MSLSKDRSLFLFAALSNLKVEPLLQCNLDSPPLCCDWRADSQALLVGTGQGSVLEVVLSAASSPMDTYITTLPTKAL